MNIRASLKDRLFLFLNRTGLARRSSGLVILLLVVFLVGTLARLAPLAVYRFHQDEAIYGYWALLIATGRDVWLESQPVDKPPLHMYLVALSLRLFGATETAARLPGELASVVSLLLFFFLARRLYGQSTALVSLALLSFSPFHILFAPTALTDPVMVAWVLAAMSAAVCRRWGWAGFFLGLGIITKPQAGLFAPLAFLLGLLSPTSEPDGSDWRRNAVRPLFASEGWGVAGWIGRKGALFALLRLLGGMAPPVVGALVWDVSRAQRPGFFAQSIISYGGVRWARPEDWLERAGQWRSLLTYLTGSAWLDTLLVVGLPLLLLFALFRHRRRSGWIDWVLMVFVGLFLLFHIVLDFRVWDRYLLGVVPCLLLLLARVLVLPGDLLVRFWPGAGSGRVACGLLVGILLLVTTVRPVQDAAAGRFPIGGDHGAYSGIDGLINYFRSHVPGGAVVYHCWLGWHYSFYGFDFPYLFQWYTSPAELVRDALGRPGVPRYVAFPSWRSATQLRWELDRAGLTARPVYETYRHDGSRSFTLYMIEEKL